ncbi:MAG: XRE family transcriptional regulator [Oceanospirillaceae bacterium]|jgi:transcriptional regulator with XRE-family HTH domain|uniref:helix-turn-helix domain-containing protein n=1 Tax=Marinobacterium litorale TaxID=404770 RepID=UPI0003FCE9A9|nr:XRE family transcriptional regulator [Marinobacterium litorale]MBS99892.1 XRE family transcriptional regulator [Oceanospirillaceae bacterium]
MTKSRHLDALEKGEISFSRDGTDPRLRLEQYIAMQVKSKRMEMGLKITDVARIAGLSQGMVSKIENAQVSTSLETLSRLCDAIGLPISQLFSNYDHPTGSAQLTKAGEGKVVVRRGTEKGHAYQLLSTQRGKKSGYEPFLITMDDASEVFPTFSHPGQELIYILKGEILYRHGNQLYEMGPGDSLAFDAEVPHGPEQLREVPLQLLSVIIYHDR